MKQKFNHYFIKILHRKLGLPRKFVYPAASRINSIFPCNTQYNNKINAQIDVKPQELIPRNLAYKLFSASDEPNLKNVVSECKTIFDKKRGQYDDQYFIKNPNKLFLLTVDSDESLLQYDSIKQFIKSGFVNNRIYHYFNQPYVLSTLRLWWTPLNDTSISSQKFHLDEEDLTQVKVFVNISEITADHGPFTFLPNNSSNRVLSSYKNGKRRYTDNEINEVLQTNESISLTGRAGDGAFIDTSKCLHYGSRHNTKERLVLMAQYLKTSAPLLTKSLPL